MSIPDRPRGDTRRTGRMLGLAALGWALAVAGAAGTEVLDQIWMPAFGGLVALGIALPTLVYFALPAVQDWADGTGLRAITAFHVWRIPAALMFFWYGAQGHLPPLFWVLAGTGDLIAGLWAFAVVRRPGASRAAYARMHLFGFADFVVAVGTGLTYARLLDPPRMTPVATLPLALIPLFGVGISAASHIVAFDMLRRGPAGRARSLALR